jgi:hypothetical protein
MNVFGEHGERPQEEGKILLRLKAPSSNDPGSRLRRWSRIIGVVQNRLRNDGNA